MRKTVEYYVDEPKLSGGRAFYPITRLVSYIVPDTCYFIPPPTETIHEYFSSRPEAEDAADYLNKENNNG